MARTITRVDNTVAHNTEATLQKQAVAKLIYRALEARMVFDAAMGESLAEAADSGESAPVDSSWADVTAAIAATAQQEFAAAAALEPALITIPSRETSGETTLVRCILPAPKDGTAAGQGPLVYIPHDGDGGASDVPVEPEAISCAIPSQAAPTSIVFVDPRVANPEVIVAHIATGAEIVFLDMERGGLEQIAAHLAGRTGIASLHILSHGANGQIGLGGSLVSRDTLEASRDALTAIGRAVQVGGDILIYGCDVASDAAGRDFIDTLARMTGDDVAASIDGTGAADLGGDWLLEYATGAIDARSIDATPYASLLALVAIDDTNTISASATVAVTGNVLTNDTGTNPRTITEVHGRPTSVGVPYQTAYGTITMNANGTYSYLVDANNATVLGLTAGQSITDIIAYAGRDGASATPDYGYLTITINGVSNAPIADNNFASVTPVSAPAASGNLITDATGGAQPDLIDRPQSLFRWETQYTNGQAVNGTTRTVDGVTVSVSTTNISAGTFTAVVSTATQGGHTGYLAETIAPTGRTYTAPTTTFGFSQPVVNLSFGLLDVDNGSPSWQDQVTITATRGGVPVTFQAQFSGWVTRTGDSFFGNNGGVNNTDANGNVVIVFDGPVDNVVVRYNDGPNATATTPGSHLIGISDLAWQNSNGASIIIVNGITVPAGGTTIPATYGTITIQQNGDYTYNVDPTNPAVIALPVGATLTDTIPYTLRDSLGQTDTADLIVTINGRNELPVLDLNGTTAGSSHEATYIENGTPVSIANGNALITDVDTGSSIASATVVLTNRQPGDVLAVSGLPAGVTAVIDTSNPAQITVTLTGVDSRANYAAYLANIKFSSTSESPNAIDRTINVTVNDGLAASNAATSIIHVTPVNDAPAGSDATRAISEDVSYTFSTADFGFTDPLDTPANALQSVIITTLPSVADGVLRLNGVAVIAGQELTTAQIAQLTFTPASNVNGSGLGGFTFQVRDTGGTANGGVNLDASPNTFRFNIAAVNDAPVAAADTGSTFEDTAVTLTAAALLANDTDIDAGDSRTLVSVQSASNGTVALDGAGNPVFTPNANFVGTGSFTYTMRDAAGALSTATVTITVAPVNDMPSGADATRTINEDAAYTFSAADFQLTDGNDTPAHVLQAVVITTLPSATDGVLRLNGVAVTAGQAIAATDLTNLTFTPTGDRNGTGLGAFTFQVRDSGGTASGGVDTDSTPNTFRFNVTAIADITGDSIATLEDMAVSFNVLAGTGGATGDSFEGSPQVTAITQPAGGNVVFAANGAMTFTPNANFNGSSSFTYTVTSGGVSETATVVIGVTVVNDAPASSVPGPQSVNEDAVLNFAGANAITVSDIDAGPTGIETVTLTVAHGTLTLAAIGGVTGLTGNGTNTVTFSGTIAQLNTALASLGYRGDANYNGPDQLQVQVLDDGRDNGTPASNGALPASIRVVPITVVPVNDPPVAVNDTIAAAEDTPITIPATTLIANDTDLDGDTLIITAVGPATNGSVAIVNGNPVFTPAPNYFGPASFTYTISDGNGGFATATVNLVIAPVNDAPVAVNDTYATTEDATLTVGAPTRLTANDTDIDGGVLSVVQVNGNAISSGAPITLPSGALLTQNADGTFAYNPNGAFDSLATGVTTTDGFTYRVSDGNGGFATATATITITGVNDAPVAVADTNSTDPRVAISSSAATGVLVNDTDADTAHTALIVTGVTNGATSVAAGGAIAGSNGGTFTIKADGSYAFNPGTDFDNLPAGSSATTSVTYTVSDGQGGTATATLTISVPYQNLPPFVAQTMPPQTSTDGTAITLATAQVFSDPNPIHQGNLTISASGLPPGLSIDATGTITGTLTADASQHAGPYVITLTATDPSGSQISTTFQFTVANVGPTAINDTNSVGEHSTTTGNVLGNDADGGNDSDALTVTRINGTSYTPGSTITLPSGAQIVMAANGTYSYDPNSAFNGMAVGTTAIDSFTYQVSDGQGGFITATATVTINGQNDTPVIIDPNNPGTPPVDPNHVVPPQTGLDGTAIAPLTVRGYFTDPDNGDTLTLSVTGALPAGITFDASTGIFTGTPAADASQGGPGNNGAYTVLVNAADGHGGVVSTTVTFTIGNPAPIANNDSNTVAEHATTSGNVIGNDADGNGDGDALTVASVNGTTLVPGSTITLPSGAELVMQADGSYSYNPNGVFIALQASETATDTFTYIIGDGQGGTATAIATIIIQGQNDAPIARADTNTTDPRVAITVAAGNGVLGNDSDPEADPLSVTGISNGITSVGAGAPITGTNGGTFTINADGSYSFDPGTAFDSLPPGATASTSVTYTISDGQGGTSTTTLTISVPYTNLPPAVQQPIAAQLNADGNTVAIPVNGVFADPNPGDVLTITATGLPPGLSYNALTGAIEGTLTANASQNGGQPYIVTLTADDGLGGTVTSTFQFTVTNPVPVASNDINSVTEHGTTSGAVIGNDDDGGLDGDTLTVSQVNGVPYAAGATILLPSSAELVMNADGTYGYDPNGAFNGLAIGETRIDTFTYQISDGQGGVSTATVTITVIGQNDTPIIVDPANPGTPIDPNHVVPRQTGQDGTAIVPLTVTTYFGDPDTTDALTLSVNPAQLPPGVTFDPATGTFSGTPTASASQGGNAGPGVYDVVVTAADGHGGTVSTTVRFSITNPAPVAIDDANSVGEHASVSGSILPNDTDGGADGDSISVSQVNGAAVTTGATIALPSGALLVMNSNGTYDYDPNGAFAYLQVGDAITDSFVYQISDGQGGFSTARVTIVINGANDAPTANVDTNAVAPQGSIAVVAPLGVLSNDTDPESDPLVVTAITNGTTSVAPGAAIAGSNGGTFTINADGSYTFAAGNDFDGLQPGTTSTTSVTYTISDGMGGTSTTTLTISVPFSDLPPVVNQPLPAQNSTDGSLIAISVTNVFRDPNPGDTLVLEVTDLPPGLSFDPLTKQITGTLSPDASQGGPYTVTLTATDGNGHTVSTTFDFTVTNPPPVALNDTNAVDEHDVITGALAMVNDRDGGNDADALTVTDINGAPFAANSVITLPSGALLTMAADGTYAYDPNGMFDGMGLGETASDSFTYQISDGQGGTSTATVAITIRGENDAPVLVDPANPGVPVVPGTQVLPTHSALDGSPIVPLNVTGVFGDPDRNDTLTLSVPTASLPSGVTFDPATGTFSGTPTADASQGGPGGNGIYPIVVTATDANGLTTSTIVVFQVGNPTPVAADDANSVGEDSTVNGNVIAPNDRDGGADGDTLSVTAVNGSPLTSGNTITLPSGALLVMNSDGTYDYDPNGVFDGLAVGETRLDTVTYQISDGQGGFDTATATIVINGANDTPVVIDPATGLPPANPMAIIPVQPGNDGSPITPVSVAAYFADPDSSDILTLSVPIASLPPGVTFDPATGTFTGTPTAVASTGGPGGNGIYPVVITATDPHGATVTTVITFTIGNVAPTAADDAATTTEDTAITGAVIANDRDGGGDTDVLAVTHVNGSALSPGATLTLPSGAELVMRADGTFDYDPNGVFGDLAVGAQDTDTFTYQISDGQGGVATATVMITITGVNDAPVVVDPVTGLPPADPLHVVPGRTATDGSPITPVSVAAVFTDPDTGDVLTVSVVPSTLPPGIVFDPATGTFTGTPTADASQGGPGGNGVYPVVVTADDGHGGTVTTIVTFTIGNADPVAADDALTVPMTSPRSGTVLPNDADSSGDGDALSVTEVNGQPLVTGAAITLPSGALLVMNADGTYSYDPNGQFSTLGNGQTASDSFSYQISDGQGGFDTATVRITIAAVNIAPIVIDPTTGLPPADPSAIVPPQSALDGDAVTTLDVRPYFTDPNAGTTLTFAVPALSLPAGISFDPATGTFSGTPAANASQGGPANNGVYPIVVTASDGFGGSVSTVVIYTVANVAPTAADDAGTVGLRDTLDASVIGNDADGGRDGDTLVMAAVNGVALIPGSIITLPSGALLTMAADGSYSYDPNGTHAGLGFGQTATDSFSYEISDGNGGTATAIVNITITGINDPPVVIDPTTGLPPADRLHVVPAQTGSDGSPITALDVRPYFTDPNIGDTLTLSVPAASLPAGVTFDPATGTFSGTPTADASQGGPGGNGTYPVVVTATDANGLTTSTIVTFTVTNPPPVAIGDVNTVGEHATTSGAVLPNDRDGSPDTDALSVTAVNGSPLTSGSMITLPSGALLVMNSDGTYDYDPNGVFDGLAVGETRLDTFTYQVSDGQGGFDTAAVTITIVGANDTPVVIDPVTGLPPANPMAVIPVQTGRDGEPITPVSVTPFFTDPDRTDPLTLSVPTTSLPPGVLFDPATGTFTGTPTADASTGGPGGNGIYPVVITATDPHGATVTTVITFTFGNVAPGATDDTATTTEDTAVTGTVLPNDRDGGSDTDVLTVTAVNGAILVPGATVTLPSGALLTVNTDGTYVYAPNGVFGHLAVGETARDTFSYQISDGQGGFATATVVITVVGENDAPVTTGSVAPLTGRDGDPIQPLDVSTVFADQDTSDTLTFTVAPGSLPPGLSFDPATGIFTGTPTADASQGGPAGNGVYPVVVTASDGHGGTVTTLVTFTFSNPAPIATGDALVRTAPDATVILPVLVNDRDGGNDHDALSVTSATASSGTVSINPDGTLAFTPDAGFTGLVTITYVISDGQGGTATASAHVLVTIRPPVTSPTVTPPASPTADLPANTGIAVEGAVLMAVQGVDPLNAISGSLGASGAIDAAANQISGLGTVGRGGQGYAVTDPRITNPVWRLQEIVTREFGRGTETWQPDGLTGFSLRFTYATEDTNTERKAELVLDSLVRERTLIVNLSSTSVPSHAHVTEYRVMQVDGRPLPQWLDQAGGRVLIGERPVDVEEIRLRVIAILSDGSSIERHVIVQTTTGEIKPLNEKRTDLAPTFGEQLQRHLTAPADDFDTLLRALGR